MGRQRRDHRAPARPRVVPDEYCDTLRHISVHVSGIVPADCFRVWPAVRDFGAVDKWYPSAEGSSLQARPRPARLFSREAASTASHLCTTYLRNLSWFWSTGCCADDSSEVQIMVNPSRMMP